MIKIKNTDHLSILINWTGPVSEKTLKEHETGGLYLYSGMQKYQRNDEIQYIGITEQRFEQRFRQHHVIPEITRNRRCWIGTIIFPINPTRLILEQAEAILIYFVDPTMNERKKIKPPALFTTVVSHWYKENGKPRYNRQGLLANFPDVISWDGKKWREGNLRVWDEIEK